MSFVIISAILMNFQFLDIQLNLVLHIFIHLFPLYFLYLFTIFWSPNFSLVNLRIIYWSPSYADLRINLIPLQLRDQPFDLQILKFTHLISIFTISTQKLRDQPFDLEILKLDIDIYNIHTKILISGSIFISYNLFQFLFHRIPINLPIICHIYSVFPYYLFRIFLLFIPYFLIIYSVFPYCLFRISLLFIP